MTVSGTPSSIANFLALLDYPAGAIALTLVATGGVDHQEALAVADAAVERHESHRKYRNEATRARYADALAAEFTE